MPTAISNMKKRKLIFLRLSEIFKFIIKPISIIVARATGIITPFRNEDSDTPQINNSDILDQLNPETEKNTKAAENRKDKETSPRTNAEGSHIVLLIFILFHFITRR